MNDNQTTHLGSSVHGPEALPYEAASSSELLSATHLFTVQLNSIDPSEWVLGDDGLEHREIRLSFRLVEVFKGVLSIKPDDTFDLKTEQRREDELMVNDYHGFWSHVELDSGASYLVIARGTGSDPAMNMEEPAIQSLMDASLSADVTSAKRVEQQVGAAIVAEKDQKSRRDLGRQLLQITYNLRNEHHGLFGRYVWARLAPLFPLAEDDYIKAILQVVTDANTTIEMRESLLYALYEEILMLEPTPERSLTVISSLFGLLLQPEAAPLFDRLLQVPIYNLLFRPEAPPQSVLDIIPDASDREQIGEIIAEFTSPRVKEILTWLQGN